MPSGTSIVDDNEWYPLIFIPVSILIILTTVTLLKSGMYMGVCHPRLQKIIFPVT